MKDSIRRIQQDGYSKPLLELMNRWRTQNSCAEYIKKDNEHCVLILFNHNGLRWYHEGIVEKSSSVLLEVSKDRVIEVAVASHKLLRVNGEVVKDIESNQVLDLSDDGERWEGDVLDNQPYGWGVLYDSENRKVYEGFRIGKESVCYGTRYYPDIQKVEYKGMIYNGKRWGRGIQYDRNGNTMFEGEWVNDAQPSKRVVLNEETHLLHPYLEELIVQDNSCNGPEWTALNLSFMPKLRLFEVGDNCFEYVDEVKLVALSELERVVMGQNSFTKRKGRYGYDPSRHFDLENCPSLKELKIGRWSFSDYSTCKLDNLPSLEGIEMGEGTLWTYSFYYASLELKSASQRMK